MSGRVFLDTNVLLYAHDSRFALKQRAARDAITTHAGRSGAVISTQVLQEFFINATRKLGLSAGDAQTSIGFYSELRIIQVTTELIVAAIELHRLRPISFWDALIVKAAAAGKCTELWTEALNAGELIDGVLIVNPFADLP